MSAHQTSAVRGQSPGEKPPDWRQRGACRDVDPELFFPVGDSGPALRQLAEAKTVCRGCPVIADCLAWALRTGQEHGVAGGMSAQERDTYRRTHLTQVRTLPPVDERIAIVRRLAEEEGLTDRQIGAVIGNAPSTVRKIRDHANIPAAASSGRRRTA